MAQSLSTFDMTRPILHLLLILVISTFTACEQKRDNGQSQQNPPATSNAADEEYTPTINLPPTNEKESNVKYSKVIGWPEGKTPATAPGLEIIKFASGIKSPRNIYVAPNGDIFVAFANTESK